MNTPIRSAADGKWTLAECFARAGVQVVGVAALPAVTFTSLTDDSRKVQPGSCYVAIRGTGIDGHQYVGASVAAGARVVVVDRALDAPQGAICIRVKDTREALAKLAAAYYGLCDDSVAAPRLIGITGTNGKTTVAWLVRSILQAAGHAAALIGTIEYDLVSERRPAPLTTPGPLELCHHLATARSAGATYAVLEASSHALDQRRCDGLHISAGVFTNLSGDHLDYHRTMTSYAAAKRRLFDRLNADGVAVVNRDDPTGRSLLETLRRTVVSFGLDDGDADVGGSIETLDLQGSTFVLRARSFETRIRVPLVGRHNVSNALAAAATTEALGISPDAIGVGLEAITGVPGRLQRVGPVDWPFSVLVDYAHTDGALEHVLKALRPMTRERLICVFGCGGNRDRTKRPRMAAAAGRFADIAFVTSDNPRTEDPRQIIDEIVPGFGPSASCEVRVDPDRRQAIEAAILEAQPGDVVLIAGKGHETYQLVGDQVLPFDDAQVADACLAASGVQEEVA